MDVRRIFDERDFEKYLGIQRPLSKKRVKELSEYVKTVDACFPTSIILSVSSLCAEYNEQTSEMTLQNYLDADNEEEKIIFGQIAKVIDGQHRIEGLKNYNGPHFDINVSIFVDIDVAEQAYIFSTVNLAQTKVNKSLVYDLFDYAKARSPQKLCHKIAVALDGDKNSPFYQRIRRLGVATKNRYNETITQATFVEALLKYISKTKMQEMHDRDLYLRGKKPKKIDADESRQLIFRNMMIEEKDFELTDIIWNYFEAVKTRWPHAWDSTGTGYILNRTNGFRALMRFLRNAYCQLANPGCWDVPKVEDFLEIFKKIEIEDGEFTSENFKPGSSGESELYKALKKGSLPK
ncbi:conserved hypothetical protein [Desulfosudis oleivorans Hxd3]|uniref:DGQHR domain-containing protein n=1 Tax=Desulfosudis oleivorans (strain DSM 6200 / JCM 39069 / Hxd3) TaxID=96561 RepID=A8ZVS1_DESOH|nr:conserved hypothetical protein [Desulfosudis oleivorans Hxd3]